MTIVSKFTNTLRSGTTAFLVSAVYAGTASVALAEPPAKPGKQASYSVLADYTHAWTREDALNIELDSDNTLPLLNELPVEIITDEVWIWDSWPLTNLETRTVRYKGWNVLFSLTADRDLDFVDRHWTAEIGFSVSRDGKSWEYQGDLFPEEVDPPGLREWAGSAILVGDRVYAYYTASGEEGAEDDEFGYFHQEIAVASAKINADKDGVWFSDWSEHKVIAEADGEMYQTLEQSIVGPIIYGFRDPWVFRNPQDGLIYMLFEGNTAGERLDCGVPDVPGDDGPKGGTSGGTDDPSDVDDEPKDPNVIDSKAEYYNGNVGLALGLDLTTFELLPPILHANCVNQQLERPHAVFSGNNVYLFTISHKFTFAPNLQSIGADGLYGFVGPSLRSEYIPLNTSGLVLANPRENNTQAYSWYVMPGFFVEAFLDNVNGEYAGTLTNTLKFTVKRKTETEITKIFDSPFVP